jgi:hypothetical protein
MAIKAKIGKSKTAAGIAISRSMHLLMASPAKGMGS